MMTRRELLALMGTAPLAASADAPTAPVAIGRCRSYRSAAAVYVN